MSSKDERAAGLRRVARSLRQDADDFETTRPADADLLRQSARRYERDADQLDGQR
jgi:hypothetical protein